MQWKATVFTSLIFCNPPHAYVSHVLCDYSAPIWNQSTDATIVTIYSNLFKGQFFFSVAEFLRASQEYVKTSLHSLLIGIVSEKKK